MPTYRSASETAVRQYRQILMLPLLLDWRRSGEGEKHSSLPSKWRAWKTKLDEAGWKCTTSLPNPDTQPGPQEPDSRCDPTYEEVIYFHPFARDWLYGDGTKEDDERAMLRFVRDDVTKMKITLDNEDLSHRDTSPEFEFSVPRVEAYLCKPEVLILAVEIVWQSTDQASELKLADVLALQSRVRELYPPYFKNCGGQSIPGNCPTSVQWIGPAGSGQPLATSDFGKGRDHFAKQVAQGAEPPIAAHWKFLLDPIEPFLKRNENGAHFRQIIDDRIPGMTYVSVDDPRLISPGDFDRLVFCDTGGASPYPYSEAFLARDRDQHRYDRFWRETPDHDSPQLDLTTRYLCSGFQFVAIGRESNWDFQVLVRDHFRRQYFRIGLIAHFQRAALLKFADDMSEAIKELKGMSPREELEDDNFRLTIESLQLTFLKFVSRAWFSEVSNQLQGQELFQWWSGLLGNRRLFAEVGGMYQAMHNAITDSEDRRLSRNMAVTGIISAIIAVIAIVVALFQ